MNLKNEVTLHRAMWLGVASLVAAGIYLMNSYYYFRLGFPLDDSWIHQTYARNFALYGEWSFLRGQPSAGSTAPLWTLLLSLGYWLRLEPLVWSTTLGILCLWGVGLLAEQMTRSLAPAYQFKIPLAGLLVILDWRFIWASVSGMEILLFTFLVLSVLNALINQTRRYIGLGLLVGLTVWVRPDALTLMGPVIFVLWFSSQSVGQRLSHIVQVLLGLLSLLAPYVLLNLSLSGSPFPNTFYAKQAEYVSWQAKPALNILQSLAIHIASGILLAFVVSLLIKFWQAIRQKQIALMAALFWAGGYMLLFAFRLPMYQHGRYIMPALGVLLIFGATHFWQWYFSSGSHRPMVRFAWSALVGMLTFVFFVFGALTYARDVAFIESEMVDTAHWVNQNIPDGAVIAVHDIGAIGYFNRNYRLVDLAGLITPQVIPFIRDESHLKIYLNEQAVAYLIIFPNWYPTIARDATKIHTTEAIYAPALGGENMVVYQWFIP